MDMVITMVWLKPPGTVYFRLLCCFQSPNVVITDVGCNHCHCLFSVDKPVGKADSDCAEQHGQHEAKSPTMIHDEEPSSSKKGNTGKLSVCMW